MCKLWAAGTAMLVCLALGGMPVAAQDDEDAPVWVKLVGQENCRMEGGAGFDKGALAEVREVPIICENTYSDPRLDGTQYLLYNEDCFESGICVGWGNIELVGADGSWTGWWHEIDDDQTDGTDDTSFYLVLTGAGAHQGLTAILFSLHAWGEFPDQYGVVYRGDPPPGPEELLNAG